MDKEALVIYLNDDGVRTSCYAIVISKENNLVSFKPTSSKNTITIPTNRLLKIKEKDEE